MSLVPIFFFAMGFGGLGGDWGGVQMICQCQTPNSRMPKGSFVEELLHNFWFLETGFQEAVDAFFGRPIQRSFWLIFLKANDPI